MPFTPEQEQLFSDLVGSLPKDGDEAALVRRVERCLGALLRREGDQEFRTVVLNAFTSGLPNHSAEERVDLAEHVLHIVVEKRPEIAIAWVLANGKAAEVPLKRRESDRLLAEEGIPPSSIASKAEPQAQAEAETPAESESVEAQPEPPPYAHDWIEAMVSEYLCHALERKLKVFHLPATGIPSVTYCFTAPFFLSSGAFITALKAFFGGPFLEANRQVLETHLYKIAKRRKLADAEARHAFLQEHRPLIWKILGEKLGKLAGLHKNAQAQLAKQAATADQPPQFKIVQIPVTVPKVYKVLGVTFHLGTEVKMRKTKVQVTQGLEPAESEAHLLYTRFNELCRAEGVTLPDGADFQFLKCLLEFDANKFSKFHKEYKALADHPETTPRYLSERLKYLDTALNNYLSDVLSLMLFYDGCFHFDLKMLYETCIGASLNKSAQATKRPFIQSEVRRRPLELAWQVREAMRQTLDAETIAAATRFLFMMHDMMNKARFKAELEQSISILEALPVDCTDDPHAKAFAEAIVPLARHLRGQDKDAQTAINRMIEVCRTALGCEAGAAAVPA